MTRLLESRTDGHGVKIAIVVSRFNAFVTEKLLDGALQTLLAQGVADNDITVAWVPGAFELPLVCKKLAKSGEYDAILALGCVIQGETDHYDYVCQGVTEGIMRTMLKTDIPILFGVLTTQSVDLALARADVTRHGNKGSDVALAALEMVNLLRQKVPMASCP